MTYRTQSTSEDLAVLALEQRVARARRDYEAVLEEVRKLIERARAMGPANPDSAAALRNAKRIQEVATRRYAEALHALSEFVLGRHSGNCP